MVRKSHGPYAGARSLLRRRRSTPPVTPSRLLGTFDVGERVVVDIHPSVQEGRPHRRFNGKVGVIVGRQGRAYVVEVTDGGKKKKLIVAPIHLRRLG